MKTKIPRFKSEKEERIFWASRDSTKYLDWKKGKRVVFPNLRPSVKSISLRLPESMLEELRVLANKRDVPYQSLLKIYLSERIEKELRTHQRGA
ncbi:MAG: BrnA antitoxin family protein [Elusimicrobia bacterium]|nr:BrnA antitoxin family protein [Elusimicrobiota bacterium]